MQDSGDGVKLDVAIFNFGTFVCDELTEKPGAIHMVECYIVKVLACEDECFVDEGCIEDLDAC